MSNHNLWTICPKCGYEFDMRIQGIKCPNCPEPKRFHNLVTWACIILIVLGILSLFSSCSSTKYHVRHRQNKLSQEVIQYQNSMSAAEDWTRPSRNWDRRPQGHWPFQFLQ